MNESKRDQQSIGCFCSRPTNLPGGGKLIPRITGHDVGAALPLGGRHVLEDGDFFGHGGQEALETTKDPHRP